MRWETLREDATDRNPFTFQASVNGPGSSRYTRQAVRTDRSSLESKAEGPRTRESRPETTESSIAFAFVAIFARLVAVLDFTVISLPSPESGLSGVIRTSWDLTGKMAVGTEGRSSSSRGGYVEHPAVYRKKSAAPPSRKPLTSPSPLGRPKTRGSRRISLPRRRPGGSSALFAIRLHARIRRTRWGGRPATSQDRPCHSPAALRAPSERLLW